MTRRILVMVGVGILTLLTISVIVFGATQALPGDIAQQLLGINATPAGLEQVRQQLGLDRPIWEQYLSWLWGAIRGDFGISLASGVPVADIYAPRLLNSLLLALFALVITVPLSIIVGVLAAAYRDSWFDKALVAVTTIVSGVPEFVLGILFVAVVTFTGLVFLPPVSALDPTVSVWDQLDLFILPTLTLVVSATPLLARMVRSTVVEQLDSEYVTMARLNGIPSRSLIFSQALPNALPPLIQSTALVIRYLTAGVVMVEVVFGFPGLGSGLISAVTLRDLPTVQFVALVLATVIVGTNILGDIASTLTTPKLRTAAK